MSHEVRLCSRWWVITNGMRDPHKYIMGTTRGPKVMELPQALAHGLLRDVRTFRRDTQQDVADALGMSRATISQWESATCPRTPHKSSLRALEQLYLFRSVPEGA